MKRLAATITAAAGIALTAAPAAADHVHSKEVRPGVCVLLARNGGEGQVQLPGYESNPANRRHPLHVKVHLGRPGDNFNIGVYGTASDPCIDGGRYLNDK